MPPGTTDGARASEISDEVTRQFERVPEIGTKWRWYDVPYRLLNLPWSVRKRLPRPIRHALFAAQNRLVMYNSLERERVSFPDDPVYNIKVPDGERIRLPVMWVAEMYSPSYAGDLLKRLSKQGWQAADFIRKPGDETANRLRRARESDYLGWSRIASVVSATSDAWDPMSRRARIPAGIQQINVFLFWLGSSLTVVVAEFELDNDGQMSLDRVVRSKHEPRLYRSGGRLWLDGRMFAGIENIQRERERIHALGRDWLAKELPGIFSAEDDSRLPVLDLLVTEVLDPLVEEDPDFSNLIRALGLTRGFEQVTLPEVPGVVLTDYSPEGLREDDTAQWTLAARLSDVPERPHTGYKVDDPRRVAAHLTYGAPGLLSRLALTSLLDLKQRKAAAARDLAHNVHSWQPIKSAKNLRASLLRSSLDLEMIANDVDQLTSDPHKYDYEVPRLRTERLWVPKPQKRTLLQRARARWAKPASNTNDNDLLRIWAERQRSKAKRLLELDRALVGLLDVVASLNASIDGIRAQRASVTLSVISALVAVAALIVAVATLQVAG